MGRLFHHSSKSKEDFGHLKARLNDLTRSFCDSPIDLTDFTMHRECFAAIRSQRNNNDIIIFEADKSSQVVILNKSDYITKMKSILDNSSKFEKLGSVEENDNTLTIEKRIQRRLLELMNDDIIQQAFYNDNRPSGSQRPRLYRLPKTHKTDISLHPILSMVGSLRHELAKFLMVTLQPVLELYSPFCIQDSSSFTQLIRQLDPKSDQSFLCSSDICSLFTNIPQDETVRICADTLYSGKFIPLIFLKQ